MTVPIMSSSLYAGTTAAITAPLYILGLPLGVSEHPVTICEVVADGRGDDGEHLAGLPGQAESVGTPDDPGGQDRVGGHEQGVLQDTRSHGRLRAERDGPLQ